MNVVSSGVMIKPEQVGYAHIWVSLSINAGCEYIFGNSLKVLIKEKHILISLGHKFTQMRLEPK